MAGLLHFLLPESRINPTRALEQPAAFADSGIPLLFQTAYKFGLQKTRCIVKLVGGAEAASAGAQTIEPAHVQAALERVPGAAGWVAPPTSESTT